MLFHSRDSVGHGPLVCDGNIRGVKTAFTPTRLLEVLGLEYQLTPGFYGWAGPRAVAHGEPRDSPWAQAG